MLNSRQRLLHALDRIPVDRPPVWLMRQAGRHLPEYRALKERHSFLELAQTPELAAEVTLQPLRRYPLDAAIIFSDILVIPEAMGQPYSFGEKGGICMDYTLDSIADIERLDDTSCAERLAYVGNALKLVRKELGSEKALLGFAGSPWTLACYMVDGTKSNGFTKIKALYYENRDAFEALMEKLCAALVDYLTLQIQSGADAVQLFDSWAGICPASDYVEMSLQWISKVIRRLPKEARVIVYSKGMSHLWPTLARTGAHAVSLDWTVDLPHIASHHPEVALQGNLDPLLLEQRPETVRQETLRLLQGMGKQPGFIFNVGHGLTPGARPESVSTLVETVCGYSS